MAILVTDFPHWHVASASPGLRASCCACTRPMHAKCGRAIAWHWAHLARWHCDPWWEPESDWHRSWKDRFPEPWREFVQHDLCTGEKHVADVKTDAGAVIEFQNSPMSPAELESRESFYGDMIWVVNASRFQKNFLILLKLPDPASEFAADLTFIWRQRGKRKITAFWRRLVSAPPG